jgi:hypothetical protein
MKDFIFSAGEDIEEFLQNSKWLIHSLVVEGVKKSLDEELDEIVVFRIIDSENNYQMNSILKKPEWVNSLTKCLEFYQEIEEYEMCGEIKKLIKKIDNGKYRSKSSKGKDTQNN